MYGLIGIVVLLCKIGAESYTRKKDDANAKQREKEQCEFLGIDTFEVRLKRIMDDVEWRKENGIS